MTDNRPPVAGYLAGELMQIRGTIYKETLIID